MTFLRIIVLVALATHFSLATPIATKKPKPANALSAADMNQLFGISLWSGDRLWDEDVRSVVERLNFRTEFASSNLASYVCLPAPKILGVQSETLRLSSRDRKPDSLLIMFANKGDSVSMKPDRNHFMKPADYNHALSTYQKDLAALPARVSTELALVKTCLTKALGEPEHLTFGEGSATAEVVKLWWWKEHAILLATSPGESLSVRIVTPDQAKTRGRSNQTSNTDLKKELQRHVERRSNSDVIVTGIPMVMQGQKGYCVPATWSRYLQYLGIAWTNTSSPTLPTPTPAAALPSVP